MSFMKSKFMQVVMKCFFILVAIFIVALFVFAFTASAETIGTVKTKGFLVKDSLSVEAFDDPGVKGVTCYTTVHHRPLSLSDSSSVSLSCRKTGIISGKLVSSKNIFSRSKSPFFKKTVVDRFYDSKRNVLIYLTYTTATGGENNSHSISVVVVE